MFFMMMTFVGLVVAVWYAGKEAEAGGKLAIPVASTPLVVYNSPL
jgi:hypothetical protein